MALTEAGIAAFDRPLLYQGLRIVLLAAAIVTLLCLPSLREEWPQIQARAKNHHRLPWLLLQLGLFTLALASASVGANQVAMDASLRFTSHLLLGGAGLALPLVLAPASVWKGFSQRYRYQGWTALVLAITVFTFSQYSLGAWNYLVDATFHTSGAILGLFSDQVISEPEAYVLGIDRFRVRILAWCSGIEGIALATVFSGMFLFLYRNTLRFPMAWLLLPGNMLAMWVMNNIRIVTLVLIGAYHSPALAVGAFHSNAGWVVFLLVEMGLLFVAHRYMMREEPTVTSPCGVRVTDPVAMLAPGVTLFAVLLLSLATTRNFPWNYPLRVVVTGAVLIALLPALRRLTAAGMHVLPVVAGLLVFAIWVLLVPVDAGRDLLYARSLEIAPAWQSSSWLLFRAAGAVLIVPLAEELLFRGYLLARLAGSPPKLDSSPRFSVLALVLTSILFGVMHDAWLAAALAGLVYALVRYWRGSLLDAVIAHGVTNGALFVHVLISGHWSIL